MADSETQTAREDAAMRIVVTMEAAMAAKRQEVAELTLKLASLKANQCQLRTKLEFLTLRRRRCALESKVSEQRATSNNRRDQMWRQIRYTCGIDQFFSDLALKMQRAGFSAVYVSRYGMDLKTAIEANTSHFEVKREQFFDYVRYTDELPTSSEQIATQGTSQPKTARYPPPSPPLVITRFRTAKVKRPRSSGLVDSSSGQKRTKRN